MPSRLRDYKLHLVTLISMSLALQCCFTTKQTIKEEKSIKEYFYYFYHHDDVINENAGNPLHLSKTPMNLFPNASTQEILDSITERLTTYFQNSYAWSQQEGFNSIKIDCAKLDVLKFNEAFVKIATITINDPAKVCIRYNFQGSTGGQKTYNILGTNLLQPSNENRFIDGVIILYNGLMMSPMDHIDLSGILVPRFFNYEALTAKLR